VSVDRNDHPDLPKLRPEIPTSPDTDPREGPDAPPEPRADTTPPNLGEQQLAERARYEQSIEATYQAAARHTWAAEVPKLESEWESHKQRYPGRDRTPAQTQPDGSWLGDGNRYLTPEQNAEASKSCADLRDEANRIIRPAIERVEAADPNRHLAGLEHMLKGEDRLKEKIADALRARPDLTVAQALNIVPDPVRFTLSYPFERYAEGVPSDVEWLKSEGFELLKLKNLWHADHYKGINSQWRVPESGTRFEMQFHTPESRDAKELTHEAYERIRSGTATPSERRELEEFQRRVNRLIATPPGTTEVKDFPGE
jgi:hypothetical protein